MLRRIPLLADMSNPLNEPNEVMPLLSSGGWQGSQA
jgi:hypothetical protein